MVPLPNPQCQAFNRSAIGVQLSGGTGVKIVIVIVLVVVLVFPGPAKPLETLIASFWTSRMVAGYHEIDNDNDDDNESDRRAGNLQPPTSKRRTPRSNAKVRPLPPGFSRQTSAPVLSASPANSS